MAGDPDVAEADSPDLVARDGVTLRRLELVAAERAVEMRAPLEGALDEPRLERTAHLRVCVQPLVLGAPIPEHRARRRLLLLPRTPLRRRAIEPIPAEL